MLRVTGTTSTVTVAFVVTLPTCEAAGQLSPFSWLTVQRGVAVGSATWPGARWTVTSLTSSPPNSMWKLKLLLAPAPVFAGLAERLFSVIAASARAAKARRAAQRAASASAHRAPKLFSRNPSMSRSLAGS